MFWFWIFLTAAISVTVGFFLGVAGSKLVLLAASKTLTEANERMDRASRMVERLKRHHLV